MLASLILNNAAVINTIRRVLRRVVDVLVDDDEIKKVLRNEVIKRETLDGPEADSAAKRISHAQSHNGNSNDTQKDSAGNSASPRSNELAIVDGDK